MNESNHKCSLPNRNYALRRYGLLKSVLAAFVLLGGLWLPLAGNAETVKVPVGEQARQKRTIDRPITGMQQSQVEAIFGKPVDWREAVGDPPISSWIYPDFVVYFEYDHVLHTVLRRSGQPVASSDSEE